MKRTLFLTSFVFMAVLMVVFLTPEAKPSEAGTCCVKFQVQTIAGEPVEGCVITITPGNNLTCTTSVDGTCEICGVSDQETFNVWPSCFMQGPVIDYDCATKPNPILIIIP